MFNSKQNLNYELYSTKILVNFISVIVCYDLWLSNHIGSTYLTATFKKLHIFHKKITH